MTDDLQLEALDILDRLEYHHTIALCVIVLLLAVQFILLLALTYSYLTLAR